MRASKDNIRLQKVAVAVGILLLCLKFWAFYETQSNAILSDALESIVNVSAGLLTLFSLILAAIPRDANHPYGHGKAEFISASVEGTLITLAGLFIVGRAGYGFFQPIELSSLNLGLLLTAVSGAINYFLGFFLYRAGRRSQSIALEAGGSHLKTDAYTTFGIFVGLAVVYLTGWLWMDNLIAIGMGIFLLITGVRIVRRSLAGIMDETDIILVEKVVQALEKSRRTRWIDMHNFRIIRYGDRLHVDCHLTVPWYITVEEAHTEMEFASKAISEAMGSLVEMFVHLDPCSPTSCRICTVDDCVYRKNPFQERIPWTPDNFFPDARH